MQDIAKLPCTLEKPGESNGICNGFGTAMCAPPFITEDCSVKDCPNNCSFNGWCSVEYPVSRCNCQPGYFGEYCQNQTCLNNCSYPNGVCNTTSGQCVCNMVYNPYNNSRNYRPWGGEDCSFIWPFQAAPRPLRLLGLVYVVSVVLVTMALAAALAAPASSPVETAGGGGRLEDGRSTWRRPEVSESVWPKDGAAVRIGEHGRCSL